MQTGQPARDERQASWLEKLTALLAVLDLALMLSNLNYVSWQDFYLQKFPSIAALYEPVARHFWQIDLAFCVFFTIEFLVRTLDFSRRSQVNWLDAMLWRWYDVFLLLPFWRGLRLIPVVLRLHQAGLFRLERVHTQIKHGFIANLGGEIAELVAIRIINHAQSAIEGGEVANWLLQHESYKNINNSRIEVAISHRLLQLTVSKVLPKIQPDVEALLHQNIESVLTRSPLYQFLRQLPAIGQVPEAMSEYLARDLTKSLYKSLETAASAPAGGVINQLTHHLRQALHSELEGQEVRRDVELLLLDLLEDMKVSYLQHSQAEALHQTLAEVHQLRQQVKLSPLMHPKGVHAVTATKQSGNL